MYLQFFISEDNEKSLQKTGGIMEKTDYQMIMDCILELIEGGMISIGDKLPTERALSERLGISRNSVREALRTMEDLGLVECKQGSGTYLTDRVSETFAKIINIMLMMKHTTKDEIFSFRRHMDKAVCSYIILNGCSDESRQAIADALKRLKNAADSRELAEADTRFHYTLISATANSFMITLLDAVTGVHRKWIDDMVTIASDELKANLQIAHENIADSLLNGDLKRCEAAIDEHYDLVDSLGEP